MSTVWEQCKLRGNQHYATGQYDEAAREYTRAIQHNSTQSTLYSNRGLCFFKTNNLIAARLDAEKAQELNGGNAKAHYILGRCHLAEGTMHKAVSSFKQCLEVSSAQDPSGSMYHEVFKHYFSARKKCYDRERSTQLSGVRERVEESKKLVGSLDGDTSSLLEQLFDVIASGHNVRLTGAGWGGGMVQSTSGSDFATAIPDCFLCPISLEVMRDPVIVVSCELPQSVFSQVSYERSSILTHFATNGFFDPVSRVAFGRSHPALVPNLALRNAIYCFLESHPWLFDESLE